MPTYSIFAWYWQNSSRATVYVYAFGLPTMRGGSDFYGAFYNEKTHVMLCLYIT